MATFGNTRTSRTTSRAVQSTNVPGNSGILIMLIRGLSAAPLTISKFTMELRESDVPFHIRAFACAMVSITQPGVIYGYSDNQDFSGTGAWHGAMDFNCATPIVIPSNPSSGLVGLGLLGYQYGTSSQYPFAYLGANVNTEDGIDAPVYLEGIGFNYNSPPTDLSAVSFTQGGNEEGEEYVTYTAGGASLGWHGRGTLMGVM